MDCTQLGLRIGAIKSSLHLFVSPTSWLYFIMRNKSKKAALTQTTEDYASRSSIHGIGYIFDRELKIADRLLWLLVVIAFAGVAAALTWNFWTQWRNEQVIMNRCHRVGC